MKKFIINEAWEIEEVEDTSSIFALIFKQGSNTAGYIKRYGFDDAQILADYKALIDQYDNVKFEEPTSIMVVKLPATGQVKALLSEAEYTGDETNESKLEIINHLLDRADCEYIEEKVLMSLEEAKKKKKKKKSPKVTYTMGWPWYNDHMFNQAMGSCDCNKNPGEDAADSTNDAIGGGESVGDAGSAGTSEGGDFGGDAGASGGEGGGMGESLMKEAMTPLQKMQALENGTRGFNAAAASDVKLLDNLLLCAQNNLNKAGVVMVGEIVNRIKQGIWTLGPVPGLPVAYPNNPNVAANTPAQPTQTTTKASPIVTITADDFQSGHLQLITDYKEKPDFLVNVVKDYGDPLKGLKLAIVLEVFSLTAGFTEMAKAMKDWILTEITKEDFKQIIASCKADSKILDKVTTIYNDTLNEGVKSVTNLTEAKRYIKRYYIRPQNVFASNKAEILQRLAEVEASGQNCSVYSLKALDDHDDVHLLQPKDIIYYYDEGVLYDKNHVPVLDYDLNVKHEEERPKISVDATSDERFKDVYQDRMTDRTVAEALEDFYLDFDDVNAYGTKLTEGKEAEYTCCICGDEFEGYGNNPEPYKSSGKCCDACNRKFVIPARLMQLQDEE